MIFISYQFLILGKGLAKTKMFMMFVVNFCPLSRVEQVKTFKVPLTEVSTTSS